MTLSQSAQTAQDARDTIQGLLYELELTRNLLYRAYLAGATLRGGTVECPDGFEFNTERGNVGNVIILCYTAPKELTTAYQHLAAKARELVG